jgi:sugar phosphate isomerase/epimerase
MTTDPEQRYLRAREVLRDAGFVFDEFIAVETRMWLASSPADAAAREEHYTRARVATELKMLLGAEVSVYEGGLLIKERRARPNEDRPQ